MMEERNGVAWCLSGVVFYFSRKSMGVFFFFFYGSVVVADYACMAMSTVFFFLFFFSLFSWGIGTECRLFFCPLCHPWANAHSAPLFHLCPEWSGMELCR